MERSLCHDAKRASAVSLRVRTRAKASLYNAHGIGATPSGRGDRFGGDGGGSGSAFRGIHLVGGGGDFGGGHAEDGGGDDDDRHATIATLRALGGGKCSRRHVMVTRRCYDAQS